MAQPREVMKTGMVVALAVSAVCILLIWTAGYNTALRGVRCLLDDAVITAPCDERAGALRELFGLDVRPKGGT